MDWLAIKKLAQFARFGLCVKRSCELSLCLSVLLPPQPPAGPASLAARATKGLCKVPAVNPVCGAV